jgi:hypothetical protein
VIFELKFDGRLICAFPIGLIILFKRDSIESISSDINTDDVLMV